MQLAIWDTPAAAFLVGGLASGAVSLPVEVERHDAQTCTALLQRGLVDVALLPSLVAFTHPDAFDVLPGAALSTWNNPFAWLVLRRGLEHVDAVAYAPAHVQEALVARIILREHYGREPNFVPVEGATLRDMLDADQDASLLVGSDAPLLQTEHLAVNLGQEWFELVNYPMVWGLFATRKDEATPEMVETLIDMAAAAERQRDIWVQAQEMPPALHAFYTDDLRLRFDDLATASLTEFGQYLYFYNIVEDVPEIPLFLISSAGDEEEDQTPLL